MRYISPKSKLFRVILWKVKPQLFPVKNKICISWSTLWVVNSPWLIFPHLSITCWPTTVQAFSSSFTEDTIFLSCFFFPPNAHLINSQAAFSTKSPSFNIFLLTRSLKKELLSFKTSFFQEFYLLSHQTIHPEIGQGECQPLKLPETERSVLPEMLRNDSGMGSFKVMLGPSELAHR